MQILRVNVLRSSSKIIFDFSGDLSLLDFLVVSNARTPKKKFVVKKSNS